jgi:hypothetical protein
MLKLYEELFLLSINDAKGELVGASSSYLPYGLAGAILAELALQGKVQLADNRLAVLDAHPTGDELLDDALAAIAASDKPRKLTHWINVASGNKLQKRVVQRLVAQNAIRVEKKRFLWVIPYEAYPEQDASAKYWVKQALRGVVLGGEKPEPHTIALLSLLRACRLLNLIFTKDERKAAGQKIDALASADLFGEAVAETVAAVDNAAAATMMAMNAACT